MRLGVQSLRVVRFRVSEVWGSGVIWFGIRVHEVWGWFRALGLWARLSTHYPEGFIKFRAVGSRLSL